MKNIQDHWLDSHLKLDESADNLNIAKIIHENVKIKPLVDENLKTQDIAPTVSRHPKKVVERNANQYQKRPSLQSLVKKPAPTTQPVTVTAMPLQQATILPIAQSPTYYAIGQNGQLIPVTGFQNSQLIPVTTLQPRQGLPVQSSQQVPKKPVQIKVQSNPTSGNEKTIALTLDTSKCERLIEIPKKPIELNKETQPKKETQPNKSDPEITQKVENGKSKNAEDSWLDTSGMLEKSTPEKSSEKLASTKESPVNRRKSTESLSEVKDRSDDDQPIIMQIESIQLGVKKSLNTQFVYFFDLPIHFIIETINSTILFSSQRTRPKS